MSVMSHLFLFSFSFYYMWTIVWQIVHRSLSIIENSCLIVSHLCTQNGWSISHLRSLLWELCKILLMNVQREGNVNMINKLCWARAVCHKSDTLQCTCIWDNRKCEYLLWKNIMWYETYLTFGFDIQDHPYIHVLCNVWSMSDLCIHYLFLYDASDSLFLAFIMNTAFHLSVCCAYACQCLSILLWI